ncbi:MAG: hypothetical protein ACK5Q1_02560 [Limnobacter sp.]
MNKYGLFDEVSIVAEMVWQKFDIVAVLVNKMQSELSLYLNGRLLKGLSRVQSREAI